MLILGDFNSQIEGPRSSIKHPTPRQVSLQCSLQNLRLLSLVTENVCDGPDYTFCGYEGGPKSLIDLICVPETKIDLILGCNIIDEKDNYDKKPFR